MRPTLSANNVIILSTDNADSCVRGAIICQPTSYAFSFSDRRIDT